MSIIITNITEDHIPDGLNNYVVKINNRVICYFEHVRSYDGLARCLRDAADAVADAGERTNEKRIDIDDLAKVCGLIREYKELPDD